jgi:hypothetical protein
MKPTKEVGKDCMFCPSCYQDLYSEDDSPICQEVNEELLKVENSELKIEIDKLNKIIIQTNQINTDLKLENIYLKQLNKKEVEEEKEVEEKTTNKQEIYKFKVGQTAEQFFETLDKVDTKHTDFTRKTVSTITKMTKHTIYVKEEVYNKINSQWVFKSSTPPRQYRFKHILSSYYDKWVDMVNKNYTNFPCLAIDWK